MLISHICGESPARAAHRRPSGSFVPLRLARPSRNLTRFCCRSLFLCLVNVARAAAPTPRDKHELCTGFLTRNGCHFCKAAGDQVLARIRCLCGPRCCLSTTSHPAELQAGADSEGPPPGGRRGEAQGLVQAQHRDLERRQRVAHGADEVRHPGDRHHQPGQGLAVLWCAAQPRVDGALLPSLLDGCPLWALQALIDHGGM